MKKFLIRLLGGFTADDLQGVTYWLARDRDGSLYLYDGKPVRRKRDFVCPDDRTVTCISEIHDVGDIDVCFDNSPRKFILV